MILSLQAMSSIGHDSPTNLGQTQPAQLQGARGAHSLLNPQEQAKVALREALEAQLQVQEAIRHVYVKQMVAQQKAQRAPEQVVTEQELAERVAAQAAAQAAYQSSNVQSERVSKELHDAYIAQESARSVPASFSANQLGSQQVVSIPSCQSGFIPYSSAVLNATVQPKGQQGDMQKGQSQSMSQYGSAQRSPQRCQEMLLQGRNQMAQSATAQMANAQNLDASVSDPFNQQAAREQAEAAQKQMMMAHQIAVAAQATDTAVPAAAYLPNFFNS